MLVAVGVAVGAGAGVEVADGCGLELAGELPPQFAKASPAASTTSRFFSIDKIKFPFPRAESRIQKRLCRIQDPSLTRKSFVVSVLTGNEQSFTPRDEPPGPALR